MISPTFSEFEQLAKKGNLVPICRELLADMETPVSLYRKLEQDCPNTFLLESVEQGERLGRYSFLGTDPSVIFRVQGGKQELIAPGLDLTPAGTPVETLRMLLGRYKPVTYQGLPPFFGGAVGYLAYDTVRFYERIPDTRPDDLNLPDSVIMITDQIVAFDHVRHRLVLIANAHLEEGCDLRKAYDRAVSKLDLLRARLRAPLPVDSSRPRRQPAPDTLEAFKDLAVPVTSNTTRDQFESMVLRAKEYILAGDIFQVVLSQRFGARITCNPFDVYRALRAVNPSPYMFYLNCGGDFQLAGSSPEILSKLQEGVVTVRPIAGTRKRGIDEQEDKALEADLLADEKERAEHVMLVDLGRNDIGRVSQFGTVTVDDFMTIERYSHVMHIVSNVTGDLDEGRDAIDVLGATFPAGTLSGAPKIRAMEIIDELEVSRRGPYGGTVVYFAFDGDMDSCIIIRTAVIRGDQVYVQAGAGIVADSDPGNEYMECVNKARGMLKAVDMAEQGLD